jgi:hypothetical protein
MLFGKQKLWVSLQNCHSLIAWERELKEERKINS